MKELTDDIDVSSICSKIFNLGYEQALMDVKFGRVKTYGGEELYKFLNSVQKEIKALPNYDGAGNNSYFKGSN